MDDFDYRVLRWVNRQKQPIPDQYFIDKWGSSAASTVENLLCCEALIRETTPEDYKRMSPLEIDPYPTGPLSITEEGRNLLNRRKYHSHLITRDRWIERIIGLIVGILSTVVAQWILSFITKT